MYTHNIYKKGPYKDIDVENGQLIEELPLSTKYEGPPKKKNFTLSGKIVDIMSNETLPFAIIYTKGTSFTTTSNNDGFFTLTNVLFQHGHTIS